MKDIFTGTRPGDGHDRVPVDRAPVGVPGDLARLKDIMSRPRPRFAPLGTIGRDKGADLPADPDEIWENMPV